MKEDNSDLFLKADGLSVKCDGAGKIFIYSTLSPEANLDELRWRENIQFSGDDRYNDLGKWKRIYSDGRFDMLDHVAKSMDYCGDILEIGAGSGWMSAKLSLLKDVRSVYALDFSLSTLEWNFPKICEWIGGDKKKIHRVRGDFHVLPFRDSCFDFVVGDAVLHHSDKPGAVLRECARVLKKGGRMIFTSEPIASKWRVKSQKKNFAATDRAKGITENIFTRDEWAGFFSSAGLRYEFKPYIFTENSSKLVNFLKRNPPLRFFHGLLFSNYIFILKRQD